MSKKIALILMLSLLISTIGITQNQQKIDSLIAFVPANTDSLKVVNTYEKIAKLYLRIQLDSTKVYAQKMIDLSEKLDFNKGLAMGNNWYGEVLLWQGDLSGALKRFRATNYFFEKNGKSTLWAHSFELVARVYSSIGKYDSAFIYYDKALQYHQSKNDSLSVAKVILNTGQVFSRKGDYTTSLNYYYKAKYIFKSLNEEHWFTTAEKSIAILYGRQHKNDFRLLLRNR